VRADHLQGRLSQPTQFFFALAIFAALAPLLIDPVRVNAMDLRDTALVPAWDCLCGQDSFYGFLPIAKTSEWEAIGDAPEVQRRKQALLQWVAATMPIVSGSSDNQPQIS
jgi:hypothetical protein